MDAWLEVMKAWRKEMKATQERTEANLREMNPEVRANNENFEVLQGTLVSWVDIHQARTECTWEEMRTSQESMEVKMVTNQENQDKRTA
jgi:hypothetical protein